MSSLTLLSNQVKNLVSLQQKITIEGHLAEFDHTQSTVIEGIVQILGGEACTIILVDETNNEWLTSKSLVHEDEWTHQLIPRDAKGLTQECLQIGKAVLENEVRTNPRFDPSSDGLNNIQIHSMLCVPLKVNTQVVGVIRLLNKLQGDFNNQDRDLLSLIAIQAANALFVAQQREALKTVNLELETSRWDLKESNNILCALSDNLPDSFYIIDPRFKLIAVNRSRARRIEQTPKYLVGKLCYEAFFDRRKPCPECRVSETFQSGQFIQRNERRRNRQEEATEWEIFSYPISNEKEQTTQALLLEHDITEKRRLETILTQSEKLAAVGQLAAGVAHEINNPLTAIIANAQILHRELPTDHDLQESVDLIARAGARAAQVVRNLLDFARKEEYSLGLTDLNETVERALELIQHEFIARGVDLKFEPDPDLPSILASQDHLQSVWLNLLLNAMDSLDKSPSEIRVNTQQAGDEIHISISDNGKGISPENITRIFEPFYTTKAPGRGTGLGLSVSHRIVKQHRGHIRVESQVGLGSKFTVILPTL
jgi:two-component system NtrC family sensor kinase